MAPFALRDAADGLLGIIGYTLDDELARSWIAFGSELDSVDGPSRDAVRQQRGEQLNQELWTLLDKEALVAYHRKEISLATARLARLHRRLDAADQEIVRLTSHAAIRSNPDVVEVNPLFDATWYQAHYEDVRAAGVDPYLDYATDGFRRGRNPNQYFDTTWYLSQYTDVLSAGLNPLDHYLMHGADEGRDPSPRFDTDWYLAEYPDVRETGLNPLLHYMRFGVVQGRRPKREP